MDHDIVYAYSSALFPSNTNRYLNPRLYMVTMVTVTGLCLRVRLERSLDQNFKVRALTKL